MKLLNRAAFALLPRQPFADWVKGLPADAGEASEDEQDLSLVALRAEGTLYLIDEVFSEDDFAAAKLRHWRQMLENELSAWDEFADHWPDDLSPELFDAWFELQPQLMAIDLSASPLMLAPLQE
ncbi:hypothetical protein [Marinobacterium sedimentorum]|uniref:hypothetical protein n=1 Tax=Marinobacterium sedimentorum TaxID=2927804 RepID=UPI0020C672BA|nr:hypothetical protein [Marinobacterium sedimentorum]MCP8689901.1 hypothetical protein [Marinobacterium sedimentorum]